ncbi:MAG TPA: L,D-transpeptidase family protein [Phenylobacterium sp.]|nr:L,D-transpeptidase family protein [Phenylobacterium sp.]
MIFRATADGLLDLGDRKVRCALGPAGVRPAALKREGDGASPAGVWPIREVYYRPDRGPPPATEFRVHALCPDDGWCDDPADPNYNRPVKLPYGARCEEMWREDAAYDIVVTLGYNDDPPVPGRGSAIFLHVCKPGYPPTAGCVAIARPELEELLHRARPGDAVEICET